MNTIIWRTPVAIIEIDFTRIKHNFIMNKTLLWTVVATLFFSGFAYFGYSPDLQVANNLGDAAHQAADAISTRNYILAGQVIVGAGVLLWNYLTGRRKKIAD